VPDNIEVSLSDADVALTKAQLEDALREWNRLKDGPDPSDIAAAEARVASAQATLDMAKLTSPFNGTVTEIDSLVGDLVNAGTVTFRIDNINQLLVDVNLQEADINSVKPGQTAVLTFDAIPNKEYTAKVTEVARVGNTMNGVVNFKVTLQLLNADEQVLPGMTAAVNITVSQLENILTVPNRSVRLVNGQQTIYVLRAGVPVAVNIQIGATSDTVSELLSGDVKEGEQIILNPPSSFISLMSSGGMRP
jgi:HlyD family secretion protein